jgi:trehalose-phosphatase
MGCPRSQERGWYAVSKTRKQHFPTYLAGQGLKGWRRTPRVASRRGSRHLFDRWAEVAPRLQAAGHIALLLDFDGTIVPIQPRPGMVRLSLPTRRLIGRLARLPKITVCIISGRRLADLRRRANVPEARYVGLHGWEWDRKRKGSVPCEDNLFHKAKRLLKKRLHALVGIHLEDKEISLAVHYRAATNDVVRRAGSILKKTLEPFEPDLHVLDGKKIWEVLPQEIEGKGRAVNLLLAGLPPGALPVYVGDDTTDEPAFAALQQGITVRADSRRSTKARYYLRNPDEVVSFLKRLEAEIT